MLQPLAPPVTRTAAPRPVSARRASVQLASEGIAGALLSKARGAVAQRGTDGKYLADYNDWQSWAKRYARTISAAAFQALVVSDLCARCDLGIEQRDPQTAEWVRLDGDPRFMFLMEEYANSLQSSSDLVRLHAWHYQVAGEMLGTQRDADDGVEYGIYSTHAAEWDKPDEGKVTIKLVPDGKVVIPNQVSPKDTAFELPREQVVRFWLPDQEWQAYATSPMTAGIEDLHRYRSLSKYALKVADAAIAMVGLMWFPGEAFTERVGGVEDDLAEAAEDAGIPKYALEELYYEIAKIRHSDSDDIMSVVPPMFHWGSEYGPPEHVNTGPGLDPQGIAHRTEALEDFSRSTNLPNTTVMGGGVGDANHWSEWLATRQVFGSAVAPVLDRITHQDLTRAFLWPRARISGVDPANLRMIRVGYDPDPVLVKENNSDNAFQAMHLGAINFKALREATGFDETDAMTDADEQKWLLEVLSRRTAAPAPDGSPVVTPVGPDTVEQGPPPEGGSPLAVTGAVGTDDASRLPFDPTVEVGHRALQRLIRLRQQLGTTLLAAARLAYDDALRQAGARVVNRARNRGSKARQDQVRAAVAEAAPLRPMLGAVGVREDELLLHTLDSFATRARAEMATYRTRVEQVLAQVPDGDRVQLADVQLADSAVEYLVAGLSAMVRARLLDGLHATLQAAAPGMVPRARIKAPTGGDILPGLPDPDELSRAAARLVRNALDVQEGKSQWQYPGTKDQMPHVVSVDNTSQVEEQLTAVLDINPVWTWVHGFYGEAATVLDSHDLLDGFQTTDPSSADNPGDPELANPEAWPPNDYLFPADHDGCTCEWVPDVLDEGSMASEYDTAPTDAELTAPLVGPGDQRALERVTPAAADTRALDDVGGGASEPRKKRNVGRTGK